MEIKSLLKKGFWTLLARIIGAILVFVMTLLFARWLGPEDFGLFSLGLTIMTIMAVIARWGTDQVLLKQVGAHYELDPVIANSYVRKSIKLIIILSLIFTIITTIFHEELSIFIFNKPEFSYPLLWFGLLLGIFSLNYALGEALKGIGKTVLASYLQNALAILLTITISMILFLIEKVNLINLIQALFLGTIIAFLVTIIMWSRQSLKGSSKEITVFSIFKEGYPMLLISSGALVMAWTDTLVLGILATSEEIGIYTVATKIALISSLLLFAMNSITAPKYAKFYNERNFYELRRLAQNSSKILLLLIFPPTLLILIFPEVLLSLFGDEFIVGVNVLMILAVGQFINVASGSVGYILTMTDHENEMTKIMIITALINIVLSIVLIHIYSFIGVAVATAMSVSIWNIWAAITIKSKLGFWIYSYKS
ncbi:flippase [Amphritea sp. 1_MG-2023]|uniref:flippase n=1 Tax=Amphritea sp. 1_MG-2023 TaxID=3062670 RepID=UPI0026E45875|nr:flippase [Amphritea sp. 1_MG-2023]MDO6565139.1 flippase [Amphritea sp. 1_MG-2023]